MTKIMWVQWFSPMSGYTIVKSYLVGKFSCTTSMALIKVSDIIRSTNWRKPTQRASAVDITRSCEGNILVRKDFLHLNF